MQTEIKNIREGVCVSRSFLDKAISQLYDLQHNCEKPIISSIPTVEEMIAIFAKENPGWGINLLVINAMKGIYALVASRVVEQKPVTRSVRPDFHVDPADYASIESDQTLPLDSIKAIVEILDLAITKSPTPERNLLNILREQLCKNS